MKKFIILASLVATPALAQEASKCADYSQQLAAGVSAYSAFDNARAQLMQLDGILTKTKSELADTKAKLKGVEDEFDAYKKDHPAPSTSLPVSEPKK